MIRAFIAISLDSKIIDKIFDAMSQLKREIPGVRWVAKENLHLTLKFLGPIDEARIDSISRTLARAVRPFSRFTINAKGLGVFPDLKRPRVLWAGLEGGDLPALVGAVESAFGPLGFAPEPDEPVFASTTTRPVSKLLATSGARPSNVAVAKQPGLLTRRAVRIASRFVSVKP